MVSVYHLVVNQTYMSEELSIVHFNVKYIPSFSERKIEYPEVKREE